jgi:hypothetical protein
MEIRLSEASCWLAVIVLILWHVLGLSSLLPSSAGREINSSPIAATHRSDSEHGRPDSIGPIPVPDSGDVGMARYLQFDSG